MTSPGQGILLSFTSRRQRDLPPGGSDALWLWLGVTGALVLGTVSVEDSTHLSPTSGPFPRPQLCCLWSMRLELAGPCPFPFRTAELPATIQSPQLCHAANPLPQPVKPELPVSPGRPRAPCQGKPLQAGQAGPLAHAPCTCLLITPCLNVPRVGALWRELAES